MLEIKDLLHMAFFPFDDRRIASVLAWLGAAILTLALLCAALVFFAVAGILTLATSPLTVLCVGAADAHTLYHRWRTPE